MSIGNQSIGEYAIGENPVAAGGIDIPIPPGSLMIITHNAEILTGVTIDVPAGVVSLVGVVPGVGGGVNILIPAASINFAGDDPSTSAGSSTQVPAATSMTLQGVTPDIFNGALVSDPSRQDSYISIGGGIGEVSIGEYSIGEGVPEVTLSGRRTARLALRANAPTIQSGVMIDPLVGMLSLQGKIPEIDVRRRKLRVGAICS